MTESLAITRVSHGCHLIETGELAGPWFSQKTFCVFLSSPLSSRTTGANLVIDGTLTRGLQF